MQATQVFREVAATVISKRVPAIVKAESLFQITM